MRTLVSEKMGLRAQRPLRRIIKVPFERKINALKTASSISLLHAHAGSSSVTQIAVGALINIHKTRYEQARALVSVLEIFCECACFDFGNFRFKLPIERIFKEGEGGTVIFMTKTIRFVKIRCRTCDYITLIPTYGEFRVSGFVYCEDCGKLILIKYAHAPV